jgi:hypothetical protein
MSLTSTPLMRPLPLGRSLDDLLLRAAHVRGCATSVIPFHQVWTHYQ